MDATEIKIAVFVLCWAVANLGACWLITKLIMVKDATWMFIMLIVVIVNVWVSVSFLGVTGQIDSGIVAPAAQGVGGAGVTTAAAIWLAGLVIVNAIAFWQIEVEWKAKEKLMGCQIMICLGLADVLGAVIFLALNNQLN